LSAWGMNNNVNRRGVSAAGADRGYWLRSPATNAANVRIISTSGAVISGGRTLGYISATQGFRPAIWVPVAN